jgi:WD40 repeat protein
VVTEGLPRGILAVLRGHRGFITDLAYSRDGSTLAAATSEGFVCLWDLTRAGFRLKSELGPEPLGLTADKDSLRSLAFSPNGCSLAYSYSCDGGEGQTLPKIRVLDIASGQIGKIHFDDPVAGKGPLRRMVFSSLAFSPDGKTLAAGSANGIDLYDAATGKSQGFLRVEKRFGHPF